MAQERFNIDNKTIKQPDEFSPQWETTFTEATDRTMGGTFYGGALFTVESYAVEFSDLTPAEASTILQAVIPKPSKLTYTIHYFSPYYGAWRTDTFYTGKGSLKIKTLKQSEEGIESISFNAIKVDKVV
jgi:hypothetical protein